MQTRLPLVLTAIAMSALVACDIPADLKKARVLYTDTDSMGVVVQARSIAVHARADLIENSGVVMSTRQPGVLFTINDSGNEAILFALDTMGNDLGAWRLHGATNVDWEAIASGPCIPGQSDETRLLVTCLYIGDVGDNDAARRNLTIYRVREPTVGVGRMSALPAETLSFTYADRPHDVEAMFVAHDGSVNLITKRPLRTLLRGRRPSLVYSIPAQAWFEDITIAYLVDSLGIVPGSAPNRVITDASLSRDGRHLAVRTYWQVYVFDTDSLTGRLRNFEPSAVCNIAGLRERQGEGIAWDVDGQHLLLSSEGRTEPLRVIECPVKR